ncbi:MAG: hypothetical protein WCL70_07060 [Paludibacter sp.]
MEMKQKIANYCIALLFFVFAFGIHQAWQQNRNPFSKSIHNEAHNTDFTVSNNHSYGNQKVQNDFFKSVVE